MNDRNYRFFNATQPQTLQIAVLLCYIDAVFGFLSLGSIVGLLLVAGLAGGAFGVANEKKWGYALALAAAVVNVGILVLMFGFDVFTDVNLLLNFMFDAGLVALLLHPMSRDYQRIWFR